MSQSPVHRKDGQTEEQASAVQHSLLNDYYVQDEPVDRGSRAVTPPQSPKKKTPKAKAPKTPVKKPAKAAAAASTPVTVTAPRRTSGRISKATAKAAEANVNAAKAAKANVTPAKVAKSNVTPAKVAQTNVTPANAAEANATPANAAEADVTPANSSAKVTSANFTPVNLTGADFAEANASTPTPAATIQKHTGRFAPIRSQVKPAKKIAKPSKKVAKPSQAADVADNTDDANDADVQDDSDKKGKKKAVKAFIGTSNAMGSSIERPEDAQNDESWKCANRNCTSGQTWHDRDSKDGMGRKVVSNFFGRNKKATNIIDPDVWHNYCRKDYQRDTYAVNTQNAEAKCNYYIVNVEMQLLRIKLWRPDAKFQVQLTKGAYDRLQKYNTALVKNNNDVEKAKEAVSQAQVMGKGNKPKDLSLEYGFPIEYISHFQDNFTSADNACDKTFDDLDAILAWTSGLVTSGATAYMPPMEFLINEAQDGETVNDPTTNYEQWASYEDGRLFKEFADAANGVNSLNNIVDSTSDEAGPSGVVATTETEDHLDNASGDETELNSDGEALAEAEDDEDGEGDSEPDEPPTPKKKRPSRMTWVMHPDTFGPHYKGHPGGKAKHQPYHHYEEGEIISPGLPPAKRRRIEE